MVIKTNARSRTVINTNCSIFMFHRRENADRMIDFKAARIYLWYFNTRKIMFGTV